MVWAFGNYADNGSDNRSVNSAPVPNFNPFEEIPDTLRTPLKPTSPALEILRYLLTTRRTGDVVQARSAEAGIVKRIKSIRDPFTNSLAFHPYGDIVSLAQGTFH